MSLDEGVDTWRKDARSRPFLKQPDGACILLTAKDELGFLLALGHLVPCREGNGHHDGHDAHRDDECNHCVTVLTA